MPEYLLVSTTAGSRDSALKLLRSAGRERPAASGQVLGPVLSAFWHDEPEITAFTITDGSVAYLDWISRTIS